MTDAPSPPLARTPVQLAGLIVGAGAFLAVALSPPPDGLSQEGWLVAGLALMMIPWWVTEALPIPATSLTPLIVLPMAGIAPLREVSASYMSPIVVLLMAGFIIAKAIERWGLHERIALSVVARLGLKPAALAAGFMVAAAGLSMWISNTATALMMTPIALSVAAAAGGRAANFRAGLLLAVAYACSIGGLATPVGSPTNLIVIGYLADQGVTVSFADWMALGAPVVVILLPLAWAILALGMRARGPMDADEAAVAAQVRDARAALGRVTEPERRTLMVFAAIAGAWVFGDQLKLLPGLGGLSDPIVAVAGAVAFFIAPSGAAGARTAPLLDWKTAERIPWGVVLLFGGGLSLAAAISKTGLAAFAAGMLTGLTGLPEFLLVLSLTVLVLSLTEFTSNVATVSALAPVVGAAALATGADLAALAAPLGLAASCAFMLPMATGPNAVAYASGAVSLGRMARTGFAINIVAALVIATVVTAIGP